MRENFIKDDLIIKYLIMIRMKPKFSRKTSRWFYNNTRKRENLLQMISCSDMLLKQDNWNRKMEINVMPAEKDRMQRKLRSTTSKETRWNVPVPNQLAISSLVKSIDWLTRKKVEKLFANEIKNSAKAIKKFWRYTLVFLLANVS